MRLIEEISGHFGLSFGDVNRIISSAPRRYKTYPIAKRTGGTRIIAQPSRELKAIQRYIVSTKLGSLPVHAAAMAYVEKRSILDNANAHRENRVILKLDFTDFFPSILVKDWSRYVRKQEAARGMRGDLQTYEKLLFWGQGTSTPKCLSIGAPSSPLLSNILLYDIDCKMQALADERQIVYTRYADDITVSAASIEQISSFESAARKLIKQTKSPALCFNDAKRGLYLKGQRRMVTGLIITPTAEISIGRERKRLISSMLHHVALNTVTSEDRAYLKGLLGFCIATEPGFVGRMRLKYGSEVVDQALQYHIPSRNEVVV